MRRGLIFVAAAVVLCGGSAWGQAGSAGGSPAKGFDWASLGDAARVAAEVRQAADALERLGAVVERIAATVAQGMAEVSSNHAAMSAGFDPLGYKAAFAVIREQHQTIEAMQKAEVRRLRKALREAKAAERGVNRGKRKSAKRGASAG
ncbi:MAG: hypothetical protein IH624_18065 [Phycisphaerae bacterium]|nr:hypothetical protein [Phycisphaerae bacterium]